MIPVALMEKIGSLSNESISEPLPSGGGRCRTAFLYQRKALWRRHPRGRRLYLQQVFGAMPHRSGSHRRPGHVVTVTRLGRAAPLPLEHPSRDHLQGGRLPIPRRRVGRHDHRARTHRVIRRRFTRAGVQRAPLRSRGLSSPEVRHVAIGHGEAAHVSLAPGPEACSLIAAVAPRRVPRDVTCPVADRGATSWIMRR